MDKKQVEIKYVLNPRDVVLKMIYNDLSVTSLTFISLMMIGLMYFLSYPKIPQNDYFMISVMISNYLFRWIGLLGFFSVLIHSFSIYNRKIKSGEIVLTITDQGLTLFENNEGHNYEYKYINKIKSTWSAYIVEVDSTPKFIIPKKKISKENIELFLSAPEIRNKVKRSYVLITLLIIFSVSTAYYLTTRDHKYYYVDQRSHSFESQWNNETLFIKAGKGDRLYFDSYKRRMSSDFKEDDSVPEGFARSSFFWALSKGNLKKIDVPDNESLGINIEHEGETYFISYGGRSEEQNIYRWDNEKLELEKQPAALIKEITKKRREEMKKKLEENDETENERNFIVEWEILGRNKQSGEKEIKVGSDSYVVKMERIPVDSARDSSDYSLSIKWVSGDNSKEFPLLKFKEGESRISEMEYMSIVESAGKSFEKY